MKCYTFSIEIDGNRFHFEYMNEEVFYLPYGRKEISTYSLNYGRIEVPQIWIITRKSGCPLFALEPTETDENKFDIMTAQYLYDEHAVQWFEPLADKYRRLIWVNPRCLKTGTEEYEAYKHFAWQDIIDFALINRPSIAYHNDLWGDWKKVKKGADKYLLVMVDNKPYWADAIGQIPFAVDTMRLYLEKYEGPVGKSHGNYDEAIRQTIATGIKWAEGKPDGKEDKTNSYDNYMVLRGCLWCKQKFIFVEKPMLNDIYLRVEEADGDFESLLPSEITDSQRRKYAQWEYQEG